MGSINYSAIVSKFVMKDVDKYITESKCAEILLILSSFTSIGYLVNSYNALSSFTDYHYMKLKFEQKKSIAAAGMQITFDMNTNFMKV